jgi:pyrroline-5-carboxylate reductase
MLAEDRHAPSAPQGGVISPGATWIAEVHAIERGGIRALIMDAIVAATERSSELGTRRPRLRPFRHNATCLVVTGELPRR